ncbi:hypothetical protein BDP27DRAFT_1188773, partial [Rhodocollybia butyracea]
MLYDHTSTSARYNAEAHFPPPLCHLGTQEAVLKALKHWAKQDMLVAGSEGDDTFRTNRPHEQIHWLYGPAGAGKSAIAQTFAEACAKDGTLAGAFFFWRADPSRNNPRQLFTTLALQLATTLPELRSIMNSVIVNNLAVLTSIEIQFEQLILWPCLK